MKAIIISILLFFTANLPNGKVGAQTIWYVDRDATGSADGTSWTDAWTTIASANRDAEGVDYYSVSAGDTIYVSGGDDSTLYRGYTSIYPGGAGGGSSVTYASGDPVVIAPAWQTGHNGDVYFGTLTTSSSGWILAIHNISNIKLTGFNFIDYRTSVSGTMLYIGGWGASGLGLKDSLMTIEDCTIIGSGLNSMIYFEGYKITIRDCIVEQKVNSLVDDQDPFGFSGGLGDYIIEDCSIIYRNDNMVTSAHRDILQFSGYGDQSTDKTIDMVIRNNFMAHLENGVSWNGMIYSSNPRVNSNFFIYNNIIVSNNTASSVGALFMYQPSSTWTHSQFIFNNTIIMNDPGSGASIPVNIRDTDSLIFKNNLVIMKEPVGLFLALEPFAIEDPPYTITPYFREIDYNAYFESGGLSDPFYSGERFGSWSYQQWLDAVYLGIPANYDANTITGDADTIAFTNLYGESITDYYTESGRDAGVNIATEYSWLYNKFPDIIYDILGNERDSNWDMGGLEFVGSPASSINVKGKIFLQGPFNINSMSTTLNQSSLLPISQPYNTPPWNYTGNESFSSGSNSTVVDWVLVELRSASNPAQLVARRAAVLKNNGLLLNTNGSEGVIFNNVDPGSYYIAIYHRNHLAIMSATPVPLSSNSDIYDFTTAINKAYGQNPMVQLAAGKYGMYASDGNADGIVNTSDRDDVWLIQNGNMGYLGGDFNMNSGVTVHDVNQLWNLNNEAVTQVP